MVVAFMSNSKYIVICRECSEQHFTDEVEFFNVEEDMEGRDVAYFECPTTNLSTKSLVYKME